MVAVYNELEQSDQSINLILLNHPLLVKLPRVKYVLSDETGRKNDKFRGYEFSVYDPRNYAKGLKILGLNESRTFLSSSAILCRCIAPPLGLSGQLGASCYSVGPS